MRFAPLLIAATALAACSSEPANESDGVEVTGVSPTPTPTVAAKAGAEPADKGTPISQQSYDFAGSWATEKALCGAETWRFARDRVEAAGASCTVDAIRNETGVGATLDLSCGGAKQRWELLTAPEGGMIVQRYQNEVMTGPQQRLVRCEG